MTIIVRHTSPHVRNSADYRSRSLDRNLQSLIDVSTVKVCTCCKAQYTATQWAELPLKGIQVSDDETGVYELALKNCACGSTIGIETKVK